MTAQRIKLKILFVIILCFLCYWSIFIFAGALCKTHRQYSQGGADDLDRPEWEIGVYKHRRCVNKEVEEIRKQEVLLLAVPHGTEHEQRKADVQRYGNL